jgi:hypothetical protein
MIFRWAIYGDAIKNVELLHYSIASFKKQFGENHQYIVFTDYPGLVADADVRQIIDNSPLYVSSVAPWKKWYPSFRLDINQIEFFIDYDVFLVKYPKEIALFLGDPTKKFAILDEFKGKRWQHGVMRKKSSGLTPFVNSGFFIQKAGCDISKDFTEEFEWWKQNIKPEEHTHHDEQGSLAIALTKHLNELYILPKDKYMLIGKTENANILNLDVVTLFHAVYPDHPAFYRLRSELKRNPVGSQ